MAKKSEYKCVLYEKGDKLISKFENLFNEKLVLEVENTELQYVGLYPVLFLKFVGKSKDISDLSNYYIPANETVEKYKDGLVYFQETKVKIKSEENGIKVHRILEKKLRSKNNELTEEDLKPRILPRGFLSGRPSTNKETK